MKTARKPALVVPATSRSTQPYMTIPTQTTICGCGYQAPEAKVKSTHGIPGQTVSPNSKDYIICDIPQHRR